MRAVVALVALLSATPVASDGYSVDLSFPEPLNIEKERERIFSRLPILLDPSSKIAISQYRQNLQRFNKEVVEGLNQRILRICVRLNELELSANRMWASGEMPPRVHAELMLRISQERENCSDNYATTSPYYELYYYFYHLYLDLDEESKATYSACDSSKKCRES